VKLRLTIFSISLAAIYVICAPRWYESSITLKYGDLSNTQRGSTGSIDNPFKIPEPQVLAISKAETLAVLGSAEFAASFIKTQNLMKPLEIIILGTGYLQPFPLALLRIASTNEINEYFRRHILRIEHSPITNLTTITIRWTTPAIAADLAQEIAVAANQRIRQQTLDEISKKISILKIELEKPQFITPRRELVRLLETEMRRQVSLRSINYRALEIIDKPTISRKPVWPSVIPILSAAALIGATLDIVYLRLAFWFQLIQDRNNSHPVVLPTKLASRRNQKSKLDTSDAP
jgi:hypothetical protein